MVTGLVIDKKENVSSITIGPGKPTNPPRPARPFVKIIHTYYIALLHIANDLNVI